MHNNHKTVVEKVK